MPLQYPGLVHGASPKDPMVGRTDPQGLKDGKIYVYPNGRVKSVEQGVVLPVFDTDSANFTFDSDTPVENGLMVVGNTATDGSGVQNLYIRLDGTWVDVTGRT